MARPWLLLSYLLLKCLLASVELAEISLSFNTPDQQCLNYVNSARDVPGEACDIQPSDKFLVKAGQGFMRTEVE